MNKGKKLTAVVAAAATTAAMVAPAFADTTASFTDIDGSYAKDAINALVAKGVIHGVDATHFNPTGQITRQDFAVILAGALGLDVSSAPATATFSDVPTSNYAFKYVEALHKAGVVSGVSATDFGYGQNITRQDMAAMYVRALGVDVTGKASTLTFADKGDIASYAQDAVGYAVSVGLFHGMDDSHFAPTANATREQVALVAQKFMELKTPALSVTASATLNADNTATVTGQVTGNADSVKVSVDGGAAQAATLNSDGSYSFVTGVLANGAHTVSVVAYKDSNASQAATASVTVAGYSVNGVTLLNAKQIQVKFSRPVDSTTATDATKYAIQMGSQSPVALSATTASVSLDSTGTVATVTLVNPLNTAPWSLTTGTSFNFNVSGVLDGNGNAIPDSSSALVYGDTTAPALTAVSATAATSTNQVTVTFNKPVNYTAAQFVVNGKVATPAPSADPDSVVLTTSDYLGAGQSYSLQINNLQDFAGNFGTNPISQNFTVTADSTNKGVASVTASGDKAINIVFNEVMNPATVNTTNIKVLDSNANNVANAPDSEGVSIAPTAGDTTGTKYTISLTGTSIFNASGVANLSVVFTNGVTDTAGNAMTPVSQPVTLNENTVAPTVQTVGFVTGGQSYNGVAYPNGAFVVKMNESIVSPANLDHTKLVAVDQNGVDQSGTIFPSNLSGAVLNTNDSSIAVLPLAAPLPSNVSSVTLQIKSGAFTDASNAANTSAAWTGAVNVTTGSGYTLDTTKPVISGAVGDETTETIAYVVTEASLDNTTVTNLANYLLDGKALPAGSYVTVSTTGSTNNVTVHLPSNSITTTGASHAFTVSNVKDLSGNVATTYGVSSVDLKDNTQPVLSAAAFNADGTLSLNFGENISGIVPADLKIYVNGTQLNSASDYTVTPVTSGADAGKVIVTFAAAKEPVAGNTVKVTTASTATGADADGNTIAGGVSVSVTR